MGKGNFLLGYGSGSIGDVTFARSKGQQVVRARNRKPNNPRSRAQMLQRTLFMGPVKFYRDAVQNLFKFAYEDQTAKESDYNAFMRHNSKLGYRLTKKLYDNPGFPVLAAFYMSKGSLATALKPSHINVDGGTFIMGFELTVPTGTTAPTNFGQLSTILMQNDNRMAGDIITMVVIDKDGTVDPDNAPYFKPDDDKAPKWTIKQLVLDPSSTETLASLGISAKVEGIFLVVGLIPVGEDFDDNAFASACIVSRNTDGGLKVSTSQLRYGNVWPDAVQGLMSDEWNETVLADWNASEEAILKGGLAD